MTANITGNDLKEKGVELKLAGNKYNLVFDFNAICDIEERYGSLEKGMTEIGAGKMADVRFLLCSMLKHDDDTMTESKVGKLITMQNMQGVIEKLGKAMSVSMPESSEKNAQSPQEK